MTVAPYKKAVSVTGDTKSVKNHLTRAGGKYNGTLEAWIFPQNKRSALINLLRGTSLLVIESPTPTVVYVSKKALHEVVGDGECGGGPRHTVSVERYKKAVLVKGDTKPLKERLKELRGKWSVRSYPSCFQPINLLDR